MENEKKISELKKEFKNSAGFESRMKRTEGYKMIFPITRRNLAKLLIYIFHNEDVSPSEVQKELITQYKPIVQYLSDKNIISIRRRESGKGLIYELTEEGKDVVLKLLEANDIIMRDSPTEICPRCNHVIEKSNFCPYCGTDLRDDEKEEE